MQQSPVTIVIIDGVMQSCAVIPNHHIACLPLPPATHFRLPSIVIQLSQHSAAFNGIKSGYSGGVNRVYKQGLLATFRVGTNQRMENLLIGSRIIARNTVIMAVANKAADTIPPSAVGAEYRATVSECQRSTGGCSERKRKVQWRALARLLRVHITLIVDQTIRL